MAQLSKREHILVKKLKKGDQVAFEVLFYKYKNKLKGFVVSITPPNIDPEEIVQKVFIKVWVQKNKIDPEKPFPSFLFTIAKNEAIDQIRSTVNKKIYLIGDDLIRDLNIIDTQENNPQRDLEQKIDDLIKKLPERRRKIFELSRFHGLSYKQIAKELNISENTVDTQIRNALNYLRDEMRKVRFLVLFYLSK